MVDLLNFDTEVRRSITQSITEDDTTHVPSGDAVYDALSGKVDKETGKGLFSGSYTDLTNKPTLFSGNYNDLSNKPTIPSSSSDLSDGSNIIKKSNTEGLIKNDGTIDTHEYITEQYVHPSAKQCNASIPGDISDLTDTTGIIPEDVSDLTDTNNTPFTPKSHSHTISDLPTANSITDGDTTHIATVDVIYDYIDDIIGDAEDWLTS